MLTRLNLTRNPYVPAMFLCAVAFVLLNVPVSVADTSVNFGMTVLSVEDMESLGGGFGVCRNPNWRDSIEADCGSVCGFCASEAYHTFKTCFCDGSYDNKVCEEEEGGKLWSRYGCGCALWSCSTKFFAGSGGTRYRCYTSGDCSLA